MSLSKVSPHVSVCYSGLRHQRVPVVAPVITACKDLCMTCPLLHQAFTSALVSVNTAGAAGLALCDGLSHFTAFVLSTYTPHTPQRVLVCPHRRYAAAARVIRWTVLTDRVRQVDTDCAEHDVQRSGAASAPPSRGAGHESCASSPCSECAASGVPAHSPCTTLAAFYFNADGGGVRPLPTYKLPRHDPVGSTRLEHSGVTNGIVYFECGHRYCWGTCVALVKRSNLR